MTVLADLLKAHGDPTAVAAALGRPPIAFTTATAAPGTTAPFTYPAGDKAVPLNVDRIALTPSAVSTAPLPLISPTSLPQLPGAKSSWLDWIKAHWMWLAAALLVLLVIAFASKRRSGGAAGFSPSAKGKRIAKGSAEAKEHMARIRAMKRKA